MKELFGFGEWQAEPVNFSSKEDVVPFSIKTSRSIAIPLIIQPVKLALENIVSNNIIEPVNEPTEGLTVPKPNGTVRICVDFRRLNSCLKRGNFQIPTFDELSYKLSNAKILSKLNAASGFFQIPLCEAAKNYTAFLTHFGRFRFKRLPMGVNIAPEIYQRKMSEMLEGIEGVLIYMDDIMIYGNNKENHYIVLNKVINVIKQSGLK